MNSSLIIYLALILASAVLLFWLFYRQSNSTQKQSEKYILENLSKSGLTEQQRTEQEKQLSILLQNKKQIKTAGVSTAIAIIVIISSSLLYKFIGNPEAVDFENKKPTAVVQNNQKPQMSMQDALKQLEQKLAANPDDAEGHLLYARTLISLKNYKKAVVAYRKVNELAPNEPVVLTELAESIALFNNNRSFLGEPENLLKKAVEIDETNQKALWLYGMTFYEKSNFTKANELWSTLYQLMDNENAKKQLLEQLTDVRAKLGINTATVANEKDENNQSTQLNVRITYDNDNLPSQTKKRATLFIYTKATTGMPMPIAVIKQPLEVISRSFPMTITLSDLNNLQDNRKLSSFESVIIGARISYSGDAIAQPGDLQSAELTIDLPYSETIELDINQVKSKE